MSERAVQLHDRSPRSTHRTIDHRGMVHIELDDVVEAGNDWEQFRSVCVYSQPWSICRKLTHGPSHTEQCGKPGLLQMPRLDVGAVVIALDELDPRHDDEHQLCDDDSKELPGTDL